MSYITVFITLIALGGIVEGIRSCPKQEFTGEHPSFLEFLKAMWK